MGNNPSKSPPGESTAPTPNVGSTPGNDKKLNKQIPIHGLHGAKATAADPSASKESATARPLTHSEITAQVRLESRNMPYHHHRSHDHSERRDAGRMEARIRNTSAVEPSNPVRVPPSNSRGSGKDRYSTAAPSNAPIYYAMSSQLQRPPRLPLPIGDANATPGSPVISPVNSRIDSLPFKDEPSPPLVSIENASVDEDEVEDELQSYALAGVGRAVPTIIEWRQPGEHVYVTGTFVNWEKKFKLHRSQTEEGVMSTTLQLRPGTHHLKFIVDGDMRASDDLPTAVDFTNHLVNYIEVSVDEIQKQRSRRESDRTIRSAIPPGIHPPQVLPDDIYMETAGDKPDEGSEPDPEEEIPLGDFRTIIPKFLVDIDEDEDTSAYQHAANVIGDASAPPSLPLFLGRSILNSTTPMKDDNSVLNYPNHTVLNHLATSSIKNNVLATSVTTRYKRKYVTTILYKPTGDIPE